MKKYRYKQIRELILERIMDGVYGENQMIPKSRDLALELGTSAITIDRALSSLADKGIIRRIARKGTFVNPESEWEAEERKDAPGNQNDQESGIIAFIVHDAAVLYPYWTCSLRGVEDALSKYKKHIIISSNNLTIDLIIKNMVDLFEKGVEGLIYVPIGAATEQEYEEINQKAVEALESFDRPYVLLNRHLNNVASSFVVGDEINSASVLTKELFSAGVENPICITQDYISPFADREKGFREVLAARGYKDIDRRIVRTLPYPQKIGQAQVEAFVSTIRETGADGILAVNRQVLKAAIEASRIITAQEGREIKLANFDVHDANETSIVATAVPQAYNMGYLAAEVLVSLKKNWRKSVFRVYEPCILKINNGVREDGTISFSG